MSTEGILLNIVENSTSGKLTREDKVQFYMKFLHYKLENVKQRPMHWLAFMEKKRNKLANKGHIMDDETVLIY